MDELRFRTLESGLARNETRAGKDWLVVPVIAVIEGVLNGEYLSGAEIEASVPFWNDSVIPVFHPTVNGQKVSAKSLTIIEETVIGRLYGAFYENESLKGEMWIDIAKAQAIGGDALKVLERLQAGEVVEVSTGYTAAVTNVSGEFKGESYIGVQSNIRPDHLALLPDKVGACSVKGGCGANRTNEVGESMSGECDNESVTSPEIGIIGKIRHLLGGGKMSKREESVLTLRANGVELSDELLEATPEEVLEVMALNSIPADKTDAPVEHVVVEPVPDSVGDTVSINEYLKGKGTDLDKVVDFMKVQEQEAAVARQGYVDALIACEQCHISKEALETMEASVLRELSASFNPASYLGVGVARSNETVPDAPSIVANASTKDGE